MDIFSIIHQQPQISALVGVLLVTALLAFASRQFGQLVLSDITAGPKELLKSAMICSALYALLVAAVIGLAVAAAGSVTLAIALAAVVAMVAFVNGLSPAYSLHQNGAAEVARRKKYGKEMAARCLQVFARIDRRGKGLLNEDDLNAARASSDLNLSAADKEAITYVRDHASEMGSVVERSVTRHHVVPGAMISGYSMVVPQTTKHYAVSESDLLAYPSRLEQLYQLWD